MNIVQRLLQITEIGGRGLLFLECQTADPDALHLTNLLAIPVNLLHYISSWDESCRRHMRPIIFLFEVCKAL